MDPFVSFEQIKKNNFQRNPVVQIRREIKRIIQPGLIYQKKE
jgi:hypothetical protein